MNDIYIDKASGNDVIAQLCGHAGSLMFAGGRFEEGDFIVTFPGNLMGESNRKVFKSDVFKKNFSKSKTKIIKKKLIFGDN